MDRNDTSSNIAFFFFKMIRFFLLFNKSSASASNDFAIKISKNNWLILLAVFRSISSFVIKTPPKADTGSPARAFSQDLDILLWAEKPHALLCLKIPKQGSSNSSINLIAESISNKLLYDNSLPFNCSNNSDILISLL